MVVHLLVMAIRETVRTTWLVSTVTEQLGSPFRCVDVFDDVTQKIAVKKLRRQEPEGKYLLSSIVPREHKTPPPVLRKSKAKTVSLWLLSALIMAMTALPLVNYAAMKPVYLDYGVLIGACNLNQTDDSTSTSSTGTTSSSGSSSTTFCEAQVYWLNFISACVPGLLDILAPPIGIIFDKMNRRFTAILSCGFLPFWALLGLFCNSNLFPWQVQLPMILLLEGLTCCFGCAFALITLSFMWDISQAYPQGHLIFHSTFINSVTTACWDLSSLVGWVINWAYFNTPLGLIGIFSVYALISFVPTAFFAIFATPLRSTPAVELTENPKSKEPKSIFTRSEWMLVLSLGAMFVLLLAQVAMYMSIQYEMLQWEFYGDVSTADDLLHVFSIMLPCSFITNIIFCWFLRCGIAKVLPFAIALGFVWTTCSLIRGGPKWLQYITFITFLIYRMLGTSLYYQALRDFFPAHLFGRILTITGFAGGVVTILCALVLNALVMEAESYIPVMSTLMGITAAAMLAAPFSHEPTKSLCLIGSGVDIYFQLSIYEQRPFALLFVCLGNTKGNQKGTFCTPTHKRRSRTTTVRRVKCIFYEMSVCYYFGVVDLVVLKRLLDVFSFIFQTISHQRNNNKRNNLRPIMSDTHQDHNSKGATSGGGRRRRAGHEKRSGGDGNGSDSDSSSSSSSRGSSHSSMSSSSSSGVITLENREHPKVHDAEMTSLVEHGHSHEHGKEEHHTIIKEPVKPIATGADFDFTKVSGLSNEEVEALQKAEGFNELEQHKPRSLIWIVLGVMKEPMFIMLLVCCILYFALGDWKEGLMLVCFVFFIIGITIYQERKTERALDALRDLSSPRATVIREGKQVSIPGKDVVRGDIVCLKEGDRVPADMVLIWVSNLSIDESLLTGESLPVSKSEGTGTEEMPIPGGEDTPFCYSGTLVSTGRGVGIIKVIGQKTEIGKIGKSLGSVVEEKTPLERETRRLVIIMGCIGAICCLALFLYYGSTEQVKLNKEKEENKENAKFASTSTGSFDANSFSSSSTNSSSSGEEQNPWLRGALMGVAVGMGLLPEEFPVVLTVFLSLGAWRISRSKVLARRNSAIETLGSCSVLCSDKTGTLTQNRMTVDTLWLYSSNETHKVSTANEIPEQFHRLVEFGMLASQQDPFDPMELAIKRLSDDELIDPSHSHPDWTMIREYPLSKQMLSMSRVWVSKDHKHYIVACKGAPETIADLCHLSEKELSGLKEVINSLAGRGLRLLGVAEAEFSQDTELPDIQHDYKFSYVGLLGYADPVRAGISDSISACKTAGIKVIMITGDYKVTASNIARGIGLEYPDSVIEGKELLEMAPDDLAQRIPTTSVFARVQPDQKMQIVDALKANKHIVAMTGDGVNDAPALKSAHIGIAMGERGTDVAREAAALVLLDDNFNSIVKAIRLGRRIFDNLCKAMGYIIAIHVPLAGLALIPILVGWEEVLYPTHIVFLELVIDPACSVILEAEEEDPDIMERPPRDLSKHMVNWSNACISFAQGFSILLGSLLCYWYEVYRMGGHSEDGNAIAFAVLIAGNVALIFENRSRTIWFGQMIRRINKSMYVTYAIVVPGFFFVMYCPGLRDLFHFSYEGSLPDITHILVGIAIGIGSLLWVEVYKVGYAIYRHNKHKKDFFPAIEMEASVNSENV
ncbi:cation-translocating P-type ATPase [Pelomyxa schiedti]|nr:cation-translocating P-type ATPase [Pelomyxa schiedti]